MTETSAILFFELDSPSDGIVLISPMDAEGTQQLIPLSASEARQQITVENLSPNTRYEAAVGLGSDTANLAQPLYNDTVWGAVRFSTQSDSSLRTS